MDSRPLIVIEEVNEEFEESWQNAKKWASSLGDFMLAI